MSICGIFPSNNTRMAWYFLPQQSSQPRNWTCSSCCISCIGRQILYCWVTREAYIEVHKMQIVLSLNYIPIFNPLVSFLKYLEIGIIDNYPQCVYRNLPKTYLKLQSVTKYCSSSSSVSPSSSFFIAFGIERTLQSGQGHILRKLKDFFFFLSYIIYEALL